jgi:hypothetical protein
LHGHVFAIASFAKIRHSFAPPGFDVTDNQAHPLKIVSDLWRAKQPKASRT